MGHNKPNIWGALSSKRKDALLKAYEEGFPVDVPGIPQATLKRRLREWREQRNATGGLPDVQMGQSILVEDENNISLSSIDRRIITLDQLLDYCRVDRKLWEVERYIVNKWEVGVRHEEKDLQWSDGVMSGNVKSSGGVNKDDLIQVKAWLVRKTPVELLPVVKPVEFHIPQGGGYPAPQESRAKVALIIPDVHFGFREPFGKKQLVPFHDRNCLSIVQQFLGEYYFDDIIILGDFLDLADWSDKFLRSPEFYNMTQPAIIEAGWFLAEIRKLAPLSGIYYIEGNHEKRFKDSIIKHLASGFNLRAFDEAKLSPSWSIPRLLGFHTTGVNWVDDYPNGKVWLSDSLCVEHGNYASAPGTTASRVIKDSDASTIFGHIHRFELASKTLFSRNGYKEVFGFSSGFLGRLDGEVPPGKNQEQWQQGFSMVEYTDDGAISIMPVFINKNTALFQGDLFTGDGKQLRKSFIDVVGNDWKF